MVLKAVGVKEYSQYRWLLTAISQDQLEAHLFRLTLKQRERELKVLREIGLLVAVGKTAH